MGFEKVMLYRPDNGSVEYNTSCLLFAMGDFHQYLTASYLFNTVRFQGYKRVD